MSRRACKMSKNLKVKENWTVFLSFYLCIFFQILQPGKERQESLKVLISGLSGENCAAACKKVPQLLFWACALNSQWSKRIWDCDSQVLKEEEILIYFLLPPLYSLTRLRRVFKQIRGSFLMAFKKNGEQQIPDNDIDSFSVENNRF